VGRPSRRSFAKVGIRTKQEVLEPGTFLTQLTTKQLNDLSLGGSLPPPDINFMYQNFSQTDGRYPYYINPEFDQLIDQGRETASRDERLKIYKQVLDLCEKDPPYVRSTSPRTITPRPNSSPASSRVRTSSPPPPPGCREFKFI